MLAVPANVVRAARSLGLSYAQTLRYITLPLAARVSFPGWINLTLGVIKDTSLVMWIGIMELLRASQSIVTRIQEPILVLSIAGLMYYLMRWGIARIGQWVWNKDGRTMIDIDQVYKSFGQLDVLQGVSMTVSKGEVIDDPQRPETAAFLRPSH